MKIRKQDLCASLLGLFTLGANGGNLPSSFNPDTNRTVYALNNGTMYLVDYSVGKITHDPAALKAIESMAQSQNAFTNTLWIQITNASHLHLNLLNATNQVYAIWGTTNLLSPWSVQTEIWPTNSQLMPFTFPMLDEPSAFFLAEDWTGVTKNGNTAPDWWFWRQFGTTALHDTNLDSRGKTLLYDYTNRLDPNIISFYLSVTNFYTRTISVPVQLQVTGGVPFYYSLLVDPMNHHPGISHSWAPFISSDMIATLSPAQGSHEIWVGLKGFSADATETWRAFDITYDTMAPTISITSPAPIVAQPMIQVQGLASEELDRLTFDVSNALSFVTNQTGYITGEIYDPKAREFTTNKFQLYDVFVTNGLNTITIHATDHAGNRSTTNFNVTLDYSIATNPPALKLLWPRDGMPIGGDSFTIDLLVEDLTVKVIASANGQTAEGRVMRNGHVRGLTLALASGTNRVTVTATDAAGNVTTTNINVLRSSVKLSMIPLNRDQLNKSSVTVTGKVSDATTTLYVNGVKATVGGDGTWVAIGVPVSPVGMATFKVNAYAAGSDPAHSGHQRVRDD